MRRWIAVLLLLGTLAAGCGGGGDKTADPTVPTRPTTPGSSNTTATTAAADIATIPAVIDAPYLNRVLAAMDEVELEATRLIVAKKDLVPPAVVLLNSIYSDAEFAKQTDAWLTALERDPQLSSTSADGPGRRTSVEEVISTSRGCVFVSVARTYPQRGFAQTEYVSLQPLDRSNDPGHHNPTAWMITENGLRSDGARPTDLCPAS